MAKKIRRRLSYIGLLHELAQLGPICSKMGKRGVAGLCDWFIQTILPPSAVYSSPSCAIPLYMRMQNLNVTEDELIVKGGESRLISPHDDQTRFSSCSASQYFDGHL
ncbi:hypothetical protein Y032_0236g3235 [Ancylostoma ceylanicum]|uniref:Uncharacterized protein n=1 Tax=Ancylostoma ceylanicum TaxID=53326 RepID=A0A016SFJ5_9BILA|nr:hypothetical protein Y032_0236g3235 [Ancylostoma ceylanicum]